MKEKIREWIKRHNIRKCKKFNKQTRCPWCGNVLLWDKRKYKINFSLQCKICKKYSIPVETVTIKFLLIIELCLAGVLLKLELNEKIKYLLIILLSVIYLYWVFVYEDNVPYRRIKGKRIWERMKKTEDLKEELLFYTDISWNCSKRRVFKFWNSKLLILIAIDENNQPISNPLCIRIRKCKSGYEITKIVRALKFDDKACDRFFVYWGDEKVGEGRVVPKMRL